MTTTISSFHSLSRSLSTNIFLWFVQVLLLHSPFSGATLPRPACHTAKTCDSSFSHGIRNQLLILFSDRWLQIDFVWVFIWKRHRIVRFVWLLVPFFGSIFLLYYLVSLSFTICKCCALCVLCVTLLTLVGDRSNNRSFIRYIESNSL